LAQDLPLAALVLAQVIALGVGGVSFYYVYRQKTRAFGCPRTLLIAMIFAFMGMALLDVTRTVSGGMGFVPYYAIGTNLLASTTAVLAAMLAVAVYIRPAGAGLTEFLKALRGRRSLALILAAYLAYFVSLGAYFLLTRPFIPGDVAAITGVMVPIPEYSGTTVLLQLIGAVLYVSFPPALLLLASRGVGDLVAKRALVVLAVCWVGLGATFFVFFGYLIGRGVDATPFGVLIASSGVGVIATQFRRTSTLTGMFEPVQEGQPFKETYPFTSKLGMPHDLLRGRNFLLEADSPIACASTVADLSIELLSSGYVVYVFTSKGSPLYQALSSIAAVRFLLLSSNVSYPKPGDEAREVLVPNGDHSVLLDVVERTADGDTAKVGIIFDSITDILLLSGFEGTYKFLKQVNEMVNRTNLVSMFLLTKGAHDERTLRVIRSLFSNQLTYEATSLKITRVEQGQGNRP
jgi:hypothetical protein